jgi:hypothetical protein
MVENYKLIEIRQVMPGVLEDLLAINERARHEKAAALRGRGEAGRLDTPRREGKAGDRHSGVDPSAA